MTMTDNFLPMEIVIAAWVRGTEIADETLCALVHLGQFKAAEEGVDVMDEDACADFAESLVIDCMVKGVI